MPHIKELNMNLPNEISLFYLSGEFNFARLLWSEVGRLNPDPTRESLLDGDAPTSIQRKKQAHCLLHLQNLNPYKPRRVVICD